MGEEDPPDADGDEEVEEDPMLAVQSGAYSNEGVKGEDGAVFLEGIEAADFGEGGSSAFPASTIAEVPHPGREGDAVVAAKRLMDHDVTLVKAFDLRAGQAERRLTLLEERLRAAQQPTGDSVAKQRVMHQMLDQRRVLGRGTVDSKLRDQAAAAALATNAALAEENEKLKYQIAHLTKHVRRRTNWGNWDAAKPGQTMARLSVPGATDATWATKHSAERVFNTQEHENFFPHLHKEEEPEEDKEGEDEANK